MKVLCVAEKPSVAKSIAQILSGGRISNRNTKDKYIKNYDFLCKDAENRDVRVTMTSVKGHLMAIDFPEQYQAWGKCSPLCLFEAPIIKSVMKGMEPIRDNIASEAAKSDKLIIWTDCDREGENIGAEIVNVSRQANHRIQVLRARFSSISNQPIIQAWRSPVQLDTRQVAAVDARSELDLRIGAAFTRFQTLGFKRLIQGAQKQVISYGSCQFPTLGFVVDQYLKAENFITETFWKISVTLERDGSKVEFWWARGHLFDQLACLVLYEQCVEHPIATVLKVQSKETKKWKPYPLTTVELQKAGTRFLRMSSQKIMTVAEALYNKGFISYPRTETNEFPPSMDLKSLITAQETSTVWGDYARKLSNGAFRAPRKGKQNDQAHPPIHPTKNTASLTGDEKTVYEFIVRRFLACCSDDAKGNETHVEMSIADENFSTTGLVILERNYLEIYPYDKWSDSYLPQFRQGEKFMPTSCEMKESATSPPELLTEAELISIMDANGIGTDATIHEHIAKILDRQYAMKQPKGNKVYIAPSNLGVALVEGYDRIGFEMSLSKPYLRREMEASLKLVCEGRKERADVVKESIEMYRAMFIKTGENVGLLIQSLTKYLNLSALAFDEEEFRSMMDGSRR